MIGINREDVERVRASDLFDAEWYLAKYPDVKSLNIDPVLHYIWVGARMMRNPSSKFDTKYYVSANPDVVAAGVNPLLHYIKSGQEEGRSPELHIVSPVDTAECIDIIIPVYNALDDVKRCLESIRVKRDGFTVRAIVINDASNEETTAWLRHHCNSSSLFHLLEHTVNHGYTKAINTGLRDSSAPYVITLNSDTVVTHGWLKGLVRCMNSRPNIGIVGPLSNAASWQNVPELYDSAGTFAINDLPRGIGPDDMAQIVAEASKRKYPLTPFVNGFCFMIKRQVIEAVGYMDEENFPIGYGEENDYCIRASEAGFDLAIADDSYVFHAKSKSFGHEERKRLSDEGSKTLKRKHTPGKFNALVTLVKDTSRLDDVRAAVQKKIDERHLSRRSEVDSILMRILFLLPVQGGGGGAHSVVQEASEMRRLGIDAHIAVKNKDLENFLELYGDVNYCQGLFIGFEDTDLIELSSDYDVVVATLFNSVSILKDIVDANRHILPAYYVQDYEPLFFRAGSHNWDVALKSYTLVPGAILFAKTKWIADKVRLKHGLCVHKVEPSIDHDVYKPVKSPPCSQTHVAAMIRPQTPRRGAERTMRVLSRLAAAHGDRLTFHLFGCKEDIPQFEALVRDFDYQNHEILRRQEVANLLARSDIFLDLSDYQAFGRTGLEAMACGCAAVLPVHGGADEYAIDGVNAVVVDSLDEDECFRRIHALLQTPDKLNAMKMAGLLTASRYSVHAAAVSELTLFSKYLGRHRAEYPRTNKRRLCLVPALTADKGTPRTPTGSGYVRLLYPYRQTVVLQQWRVETWARGGLPPPGSADVVIVQRDVERFDTREMSDWLRALRSTGGKLVYEIDDDLLDGKALQRRGYSRDIEALASRVRWLATNADMVTVSTEALAERLRHITSNIAVIPNFIDERLWKLHKPRVHSEGEYARSQRVVRIGYIGTPSHDGDLALVNEAVNRIQREYGERVSVEVIGAFQNRTPIFGKRIGLPRKRTYPHFVEWLDKRVHWDIAIIPLDADSFNRSKSHLKFIECACLDLAIVCSNVENYTNVAQHGKNAMISNNDTDSWYWAMKTLIDDSELRTALARQAREDVINKYTISRNVHLYLEVLEEVGSMSHSPEKAIAFRSQDKSVACVA